jgi:predicted membrane protein
MTDEVKVERDLTRLVIGLAIVLAGILFTLDNLRLIHAGDYLSYWPVILVAIGVTRMAQTSSWVSYGWSLVWIVAGLWLLGENIGLITISIWALWPLVLVLIGATILWRACCPPQLQGPADQLRRGTPTDAPNAAGAPAAARAYVPSRDSFVRAAAVMGGIERATDSADFRGADLLAIMGGCELDLRHATIAGDEAVVDVMVFMGGIEIYVPDTWAIEAKVLPLMGGLGDETRLNKSGPTKRLVVRGLALMGGIEIKN